MSKRLAWIAVLTGGVLSVARPVLAQQQGASSTQPMFGAALAFLVPAGIVLLCVAALPQDKAPRAALTALLAAAAGALVYWAAGFALEFGGIGLFYGGQSLPALSAEWSPLSASWGPGWGVAGLRGFFLDAGFAGSQAMTLFVSHLPWVIVACLVPALVLHMRGRSALAFGAAILVGGLLYPLIGNAIWGGGWLAHLGDTRSLGHGFVDFGGASVPFLLAAGLSLAVLLLFKPESAEEKKRPRRAHMPQPHLPLVAMVGAFLALGGAFGWLLASPLAAEVSDALSRGLAVTALATLSGALVAGAYAWFVTRQTDLFMAGRGGLAGLVASLAGAPFMPAWAGVVVGVLAGLLVPLGIYLVDHVLHLEDEAASIATFGLAALISVLAPAFLADGLYGAGWNGVGAERFLGVDGLGVAGLLSRVGVLSGWENQLWAQLAGIGAVLLLGFVLPWGIGRAIQAISALARSSAEEPAQRKSARS